MAVEPQVFICYGRPDEGIAHQLSTHFWRQRIECYNYMLKPIEDRLEGEINYLSYVYAARLFIVIISDESIPRFAVTDEISTAYQVATLSPGRMFRVYVTLFPAGRDLPFPQPDLVIEWNEPQESGNVVNALLERMGVDFIERSQRAWEINKGLYPDKWEELNRLYVSQD